jgi:biotin carboxyl carrier protein
MSDHTVKAPFPGIFYRRPNPDAAPFVAESETVRAGSTIGLIEVMKMFQEITCDADGTVAEFLVEDEAIVDAGQPLLRLT